MQPHVGHAVAMRWLVWFAIALVLVLATTRGKAAPQQPPAPPRAFRLMTYNLEFDNPDPAATIDAIANADPDVAIFQEVTAAWRDALVDRLGARYPHRAFHIHRRAGGLAVLSKLPLAGDALLPAVDLYPAQRFTVTAAFGPVQILNVHLRPPIERGSWVRGYLSTPPIRRREIEAHYQALATDVPTVIAGDFNEGPAGSAVAFVANQGLTRATTLGPTTWRYEATAIGRKLDVLRLDIDHVLLGRGVVAHDARVLDAGTSDHRPVVVTIAPRPAS